ncbi:hypothetical protein VNO78_31484 [Psophocarpus tetragonolobus]|uniref:Uncharacterized protein n=1 Tax=Psophocarpus tetragonolobus TaxID=3891 RepID=A0AAN9RYE4_PSOTE
MNDNNSSSVADDDIDPVLDEQRFGTLKKEALNEWDQNDITSCVPNSNSRTMIYKNGALEAPPKPRNKCRESNLFKPCNGGNIANGLELGLSPLREYERERVQVENVSQSEESTVQCGKGSSQNPSSFIHVLSLSRANNTTSVELGCGEYIVAKALTKVTWVISRTIVALQGEFISHLHT